MKHCQRSLRCLQHQKERNVLNLGVSSNALLKNLKHDDEFFLSSSLDKEANLGF